MLFIMFRVVLFSRFGDISELHMKLSMWDECRTLSYRKEL